MPTTWTFPWLTGFPAKTRARGLGAEDIQYITNMVLEALKYPHVGKSERMQSITFDGSPITLDLDLYNVFKITLTANMEADDLLFDNVPSAGHMASALLFLDQDGTGSRTFTQPTSFEFPFDSQMTIDGTASTRTIISVLSVDAGTKWYAQYFGTRYSLS